jgi:hypothetical protein
VNDNALLVCPLQSGADDKAFFVGHYNQERTITQYCKSVTIRCGRFRCTCLPLQSGVDDNALHVCPLPSGVNDSVQRVSESKCK